MTRSDASALAWSLVDLAMPWLDSPHRTWACTQIGIGEHLTAIEGLLRVMARYKVQLPNDVALQLKAWLRGYAGSDCEEALHLLLEQIPVTTDQRRWNTLWVR